MSAETELNTALIAHVPLTAIVTTRIYPDFLSQEIILPAVVYQRADTDYVTTIHSGAVLGSKVTVDIFALASTRKAAENLGDILEHAIATKFLPVGRRPEFDQQTETFSSVVTCVIWPI